MHQSKSVVVVAQIIISLSMALIMSGLLGPVMHGFPHGWLPRWGKYFLIAWPIAFILASIITPVSFRLANAIVGSFAGENKKL